MCLHARRMSLRSVDSSALLPFFRESVQQGCTNFAKIGQPRQNSGRQEVDMKQVNVLGTTGIGRHLAKFGRPDDLTPVFCAPLSYTTFSSKVG